jgi:hypothetical protein
MHVAGVEISGHGVKLALRRLQHHQIDAEVVPAVTHAGHRPGRVELVHADALSLSLPQERFDVVLWSGALHCLANVEEVRTMAMKIQQATKPGGYNIVLGFNDEIVRYFPGRGFEKLHGVHLFNRCRLVRGHPRVFTPLLLPHERIISFWEVPAFETVGPTVRNWILNESEHPHPPDYVGHEHSVTRATFVRRRNVPLGEKRALSTHAHDRFCGETRATFSHLNAWQIRTALLTSFGPAVNYGQPGAYAFHPDLAWDHFTEIARAVAGSRQRLCRRDLAELCTDVTEATRPLAPGSASPSYVIPVADFLVALANAPPLGLAERVEPLPPHGLDGHEHASHCALRTSFDHLDEPTIVQRLIDITEEPWRYRNVNQLRHVFVPLAGNLKASPGYAFCISDLASLWVSADGPASVPVGPTNSPEYAGGELVARVGKTAPAGATPELLRFVEQQRRTSPARVRGYEWKELPWAQDLLDRLHHIEGRGPL